LGPPCGPVLGEANSVLVGPFYSRLPSPYSGACRGAVIAGLPRPGHIPFLETSIPALAGPDSAGLGWTKTAPVFGDAYPGAGWTKVMGVWSLPGQGWPGQGGSAAPGALAVIGIAGSPGGLGSGLGGQLPAAKGSVFVRGRRRFSSLEARLRLHGAKSGPWCRQSCFWAFWALFWRFPSFGVP